MHFAFPPRKSSNPPPYALRSSRAPFLRRSRIRQAAPIAAVFLAAIYLLSRMLGGGGGGGGSSSSSDGFSEPAKPIPYGTKPVVIVTVFDLEDDGAFIERVQQNRRDYAARHGYVTFFTNTTAYPLTAKDPPSWAKIPAMRHAMTEHPHSTYFWYLDVHALITNPALDLQSHVTRRDRLESLMISGEPVVPPDSVIKTFGNLRGDRIDVVLAQDREGLVHTSFIVRGGEWARYFLDAWFDPLYRSYNFQKAEAHALEHIVQWHGTILAKLALIPQSIFASYVNDATGLNKNGMYEEGHFVANFYGCEKQGRDCRGEMNPFFDALERKYVYRE